MSALAEDLAAVFRKHGVYAEIWHDEIKPINGPIVVSIDSDFDLSVCAEDEYPRVETEIGVSHRIPAPSAHDKLGVKALHARIMAAAKEGGAA